jgi:hypothetical protein
MREPRCDDASFVHSDTQKNERKKGRRCVRERIPMAMASELLAVVQYLLVTTVRYYNTYKISSLVIEVEKR